MERLLLLGLNHTTAPIDVRERVAFANDQARAALGTLRTRFPDAEAVLLSTCNRTEVYVARAAHGPPGPADVLDLLAGSHGVPPAVVAPHVYEKIDRAAVEHLFAVACSLDSMVLGETQILGQVRQAYDLARAAGTVGAALNPLFQRAVAVGRQVMAETPLADGRTSAAGVAVAYARQVFDHFGDKTVLCVGAGKMAALALRSFAALRPGRLLVCNRSPDKATALAARVGGTPAAYDALADHLVAADVVVTSTGARQPIITRALFESLRRQRRHRPLLVIDIALPRDVEPAVGEVEDVYLYNLDDLQKVVQATVADRREAVDAARRVVAGHVADFLAAQRVREVGPLIDRLYKRHHQLAREELERTLGKLPSVTPAERAHLEDLTRRVVNKLLHDPVHALRSTADEHGAAAQYLHALERLYRLDDDVSPPGDRADP